MESPNEPSRCPPHHRICTIDLILTYYPDFLEEHPQPRLGEYYEVCKYCGDIKMSSNRSSWSHDKKTLSTSVQNGLDKINGIPGSPPPGYITIKEAQRKSGLKPNTLRVYMRDKETLRGYKRIDGLGMVHWFVELEDLERLMKEKNERRRNAFKRSFPRQEENNSTRDV
jgi:hypothetical protein